MSSGPSHDPVRQQLQLLLTAYGYNFYSARNQARADDLLVRERASYHLGQAVDLLATLRGDYQRRFIPALTRAHPDPPQEALAQVREIESAQQTLSNTEAHIRGMPVPAQDRIWWRIRQEQALLAQLLTFDLALVGASEHIYYYVAQLTPEGWNAQEAGTAPGSQQGPSLRQLIQQLTQVARDRERFLLLQV